MVTPHPRLYRFLAFTLACVGFCVFAAPVMGASGINRQINYQGRLLTSGGQSVSNGTYLLKLSLYNAASGGTSLWTAAGTTSSPAAINVTVSNGLFSIQLGDASAGQNPFDFDFHQDSLYLGVTVASDTEMTPRKRLTSVPYAFVAETLQGQYASSAVATTGGNLFTLQQTSTSAATADRTTLFIRTSGTSNQFDYLIKANSGSDVFTVSRQGNVTTTGNLATNGNVILGDATTDTLTVNARVNSDFTPFVDNAYVLGTSALRWRGIETVNATATNATITSLSFTSATGTNFSATSGTIIALTSTTGTITNLITTSGTISTLTFANGTSTSWFGFNTASGSTLFVGGQSVCLANGINCPAGATTADDWTYDIATDTLRPATTSVDLLIGGATTATSAFWFNTNSTSSRLYVGAFGSSTDIVLGASTSSITNTAFQLDGNDLFVLGNIGSASSVYTNGAFIAGGSTIYGDGFISSLTGDLVVKASSNVLRPMANNTLSLGSATMSFANIYASGTVAANGLNIVGPGTTGAFIGQIVIQPSAGTNFSSIGFESTYVSTTQRWFLGSGSNGSPTTTSNNFRIYDITRSIDVFNISASTGRVGIGDGVTNPSATLDVGGTVSSTDIRSGTILPHATNSFDLGSASRSWANIYSSGTVFALLDVVVGGQSVCLENGTNCPAGATTADDWTYDPTTDTLRPATTSADLLVGGATNDSAPFRFLTSTTSSRLFIGANGSSTNVVIGAATSSITNTAFQLDGNDLFVLGNIGAASSVYTNAAFIAGGSTLYGDGFISSLTGDLVLSASSNVFRPSSNNSLSLGTATASLANIYASGTANLGQAILNQRSCADPEVKFATGTTALGFAKIDADSIAICALGIEAFRFGLKNGGFIGIEPAGGGTAGQPVFGGPITDTDTGIWFPGAGIIGVSTDAVSRMWWTSTSTTIFQNIVPNGNNAYDLGQPSLAMRNIYASGTYVGGNIQNSLVSNQDFSRYTTLPTEANIKESVLVGRYAYVLGETTFETFDFSGSSTFAIELTNAFTYTSGTANFRHMAVAGNYAYLTDQATGESEIVVLDIKDPARPTFIASLTTGNDPSGIFVAGKYAYVTNQSSNTLSIVDIANPAQPSVVGTASLPGGSSPVDVYVQDGFAYTANNGGSMSVINITNPANPSVATTTASVASSPSSIAVQGRFAYVGGAGGSGVDIYDISVATNSRRITNFSSSLAINDILVEGKYLYAIDGTNNFLRIFDVSSSTQVSLVTSKDLSPFVGVAVSLTINGKMLAVADSDGAVSMFDVGGIETSSLLAASAELAELQVRKNAIINNQLYVGGGLQISGNVLAFGALSVSATNTTSTISGPLTVQGQLICLANATNCPAGASADDWVYDATTDTLRPATSSADLLIGGATNDSAPFRFLSSTTSSRLFIGANGSSTNVVIGAATSSITNTAFQLDGNDLFVLGNIGAASSVYTNAAFIAGGSTLYGDGFISSLTGDLVVKASSNVLRPMANNTLSLGSATTSFANIYASGTIQFVSASGSSLHLNKITPSLVKTLDTASQLLDVAISGRYAYGAHSTSGIIVMDIADPLFPKTIGTQSASGTVREAFVSGKYLYAGTTLGMQVYDISNPSAPSSVSFLSESGVVNGLFVSGKYAYMSQGRFRIVDISNPQAPTTVSSLLLIQGSPLEISIQGKYAYVANNDNLHIVDISNPRSPVIVGSVTSTSADLNSVTVSGRYAYVADGANGLSIIDVSNPASPVYVASTTGSGSAGQDIVIAGNHAFISALGGTLEVYDITSSTAPRFESSVSLPDRGFRLAVAGKYVYVAVEDFGMSIVDIDGADLSSANIGSLWTNSLFVLDNVDIGNNAYIRNSLMVGAGGIVSNGPISAPALDVTAIIDPRYVGDTTFAGAGSPAENVYVSGKYAYLTAADTSLRIYDVTEPGAPTSVGFLSNSSNGQDIFVAGRYAYVAENTRLRIVDIGKPSAPTTVSALNNLSGPAGVQVVGGYAYVADGAAGGLRIIDVSNPSAPTTTASLDTPGTAADVYVSGRYAYVADSAGGLSIIDISNPRSPTSVSVYTGGGTVNGLFVSGRYAYLATLSAGLNVVDVSNPAVPVSVGTFNTPGSAFDVRVAGRYAYVADSGGGVNIIDISNPRSPTSTAVNTTYTDINSLEVVGKYAYVVSEAGGLKILDIQGADIATANIGSLRADTLWVTDNMDVANSAYIRNSLNVGNGGIMSDGLISGESLVVNSFENVTTTGAAPLTGVSDVTKPIFVSGNYAYVNDTEDGALRIYDISSASPTQVGSAGAGLGRHVVAGKYLYMPSTSGLRILDVSNPSSPLAIGSQAQLSAIQGVYVAGQYAYVADSAAGLGIIDISDPRAPSSVGYANTPGDADRVYVQGKYAYVDDGAGGLQIIDVTTSTHPTTVGAVPATTLGTSEVTDVVVSGRYAYVAAYRAGLKIVDVSNPYSPVVVGGVTTTANAHSVVISGDYAFVAASSSTYIIDISTPSAPTSVRTIPAFKSDNTVFEVYVAGRYLYTTSDSWFAVYDLGGAEFTVMQAGTIEAGRVMVTENLDVGNNLFVGTGIVAGSGGIHSDGVVSAKKIMVSNTESASGTAGIFFHSYTDSAVDPWTTGITGYVSGTGSTLNNVPGINTLTFGSGVQSAAGYFANGFSDASNHSVGLLAIDMTSTTVGGAIFGARRCGTAISTSIMKLATDTDTSRFSFRCSGQFFADNGTVGTPGDYAEYFPTDDVSITAGEVVAMTDVTASSVKRAMATDREFSLGVISAQPLVLGNAGPDGAFGDNPNYKIVGLLGQLPVNASTANGPIAVGDKLMAGDGGYAVKASGVGMILGQAMEALPSSTGMIKAYINPGWWADDFFEAATGTTNVKAQGTASASSTAIDSYGLTFQGSAWDVASSTNITSSFTIMNDVIHASSSLFTIRNTQGASMLTISDSGDVAVTRDLTVGRRLFLGSKTQGVGSTSTYLFVDDTQAPSSTYIATNADGWSTSSTYDYAERFPSIETLSPGDLVTTDPADVNHVKRTVSVNDVVLGIVSTKPGFITGAYASGTYPIALAGRVPTRVSTANGAILPGDQLAPSTVPGVAVKAVGSGPVVGIALEGYDAPTEGKISVFVQPGWKGGEILSTGSGATTIVYQAPTYDPGVSPRGGLAKIAAGSMSVAVSFPSLNAYPLVTVTPYGLPTGHWGISDVTDHGFTIILASPETFDQVFAWKAEPSQSGYVMSFSDGTASTYDPLTGQPVLTGSSTSTSSVSDPVPDPVVSTTTDPVPDATASSTTTSSTDPVM
jgi:hypothetical protein